MRCAHRDRARGITALLAVAAIMLAPTPCFGYRWPTGRRERPMDLGLRLELHGGQSAGDASGLTAGGAIMLRWRYVQAGALLTMVRTDGDHVVRSIGGAAGLRFARLVSSAHARLDLLLSGGAHEYATGSLPFLGTRVGGAFELGGAHLRFSGGVALSMEVDLGRTDPSAAPQPCVTCTREGGYVFSMLVVVGAVIEL